MGLQLRNNKPKRRVKAKLRSDRTTASLANDIWAMDFVHDQLFDGTKIRALTIVDTLTRLSPAIGVRRRYRRALDGIFDGRNSAPKDLPKYLN
jgi:putative transposase